MIIGLDTFGLEEFAHTRWHDIRDWVIPCEPETEWSVVDEVTGRVCEPDNITDHFGCVRQPTIEEASTDGTGNWLDYLRSQSE